MGRKVKNASMSQSQTAQRSQNSSTREKSQRVANQQTLMECFEKQSDKIDESVHKLVRYVLVRAGTNMPFKKQEIMKNVLNTPGEKKFEKVLEGASKILKEVYGYKVDLIESTNSVKIYSVTNILEPMALQEDLSKNNVKKIIALLILSHIYMSNNTCSDASLLTFLKSYNIDPEERHEIFGNVNDYINLLIKQKLLDLEKDSLSKKNYYRWGPKAEATVSKMEILKFVSRIYKKKPTSWENHYDAAMEQERVNTVGENNEEEAVEV